MREPASHGRPVDGAELIAGGGLGASTRRPGRGDRRPELAADIALSSVDPLARLAAEMASDRTIRTTAGTRPAAVAILGATSTATIDVLAIDGSSSLREL